MKTVLLFALASLAVAAPPPNDALLWIVRPPDAKYGPDEKKGLERGDVFEVVASKVAVAISYELAKKQIVELSEATATYYTGSYYRCPKGKKPYLVRAVYAFGGTGQFIVLRHDDAIWVEHQSVGSAPVVYSKSALVVNLEFSPATAYATSSVVE